MSSGNVTIHVIRMCEATEARSNLNSAGLLSKTGRTAGEINA